MSKQHQHWDKDVPFFQSHAVLTFQSWTNIYIYSIIERLGHRHPSVYLMENILILVPYPSNFFTVIGV